ncbi:MAG: hypothetical protein J6C96_10135 [Oscillospiraceae bacterium]|nr:hypothetical protein [Oscillospiraceae bacterium]
MEENEKMTADTAENAQEAPMSRRTYTKQQNMMYTVISVALFFLIYFGGKGIISLVNRPYYVDIYSDTASAEFVSCAFETSGISEESGAVFMQGKMSKGESGMTASLLFSGVPDEESFAESGIVFEYGDIVEDIRTEIYPYRENPAFAEYVYADRYVDIDNPNRFISVFEFNGSLYAEYKEIGEISEETKMLFSSGEKVY